VFLHRAAGLTLRSPFLLDDLPVSVEVDADVVVHLGAPPASRDTTRAARGRIGDDAVIEVRR
jgi:hypothetical protein